MPGRNTTSSNDNIGPGDYLEAAYKGGTAFVGDLRTAVQHPIDTLIIPPLALAYDVAIVGCATMGAAIMSDPQFDLYQSEIAEIKRAVSKDPQIVEDAKARLHARKEMLIAAAEKFVANDGPGRTEMATHLGLNLLTPGYFSKALKAVSNVRKFGTPFNPPRFQYLEKHDFSNLPPLKHLSRSEIRKQFMDGELLYVIKPNGQLLLGDRDYIQALGRDFWGHPELAWPDPVIATGEAVFSGGKLIEINELSGHFRPSGPKLKRYVETVFEKNGYSEAPGLFKHMLRSKRLKSDTMLPPLPLGFGPSPLGMAAGTTMTAAHGSTPYFNSSFLFGMAYAESMSNPDTKTRAQASFPPYSSHNKKHTTTPTTPEEAQQAVDDLEKQHLQPLLELFGDIVTASETLDISDVKDMPGVQEHYEEIEALKLRQGTGGIDVTAEISQKTRALKAQIMPELIKRRKFTGKLQYASDTATGVVGIVSAFNPELAQQISTVTSSAITALEQTGAMLGMGLAAASFNPVLAIGAVVGAVADIVGVFKKKQQQDPNAMLIRIANMLFQRLAEFEQSMHAEIAGVLSEVEASRWQILVKLADIKEHQHDILSFLSSISLEISRMHAEQNARLIAHSEMLSDIMGNMAATPYLTDLNTLKEHIRYVTQNTIFKDYNDLMNKLDHLGLEKSITNQPSNLFHSEGTKPASYFQFSSYFARLVSSILAGKAHNAAEMRGLPSPLPIIYAVAAKIMLGYKKYPEPNATYASSRIAQRDITQSEAYDTELARIETLEQQGRDPKVLHHVITAYQAATIALQTEIAEEMYVLESSETRKVHMDRMVRLSPQHADEKDRFSDEIPVDTYEWFKGSVHTWHIRHIKRKWHTWGDSVDYKDETRLQDYLDCQKNHMRRVKEEWSTRMIEYRRLAEENHLSTTVPAISSYHGARFLKPTQPDSPYLPAPDPLLPTNHPQLEVMRALQTAQAYGLGSIALFYTTSNETQTFIIDIMFHQATASATKPIARLQFSYDPLPGYNRAEAIWYDLVGNPEFLLPLEGDWDRHKTANKYGHKGAEGEETTRSVFLPKSATVRVGKLTQLQGEHRIPLILQDDLLAAIHVSIQNAQQRFTGQVSEQLSHLLDYTIQNNFGRACHAFEQAYRHIYGVLSYAYFDEMQNPTTPLAQWFLNHAVNIQQLKSSLSAKTPQDLLSELSADLPKLEKILSALPKHDSYFHLLNQTRTALQDFLQIYTPYAVEHNAD